MEINMKPIGTIHTPYNFLHAPYQASTHALGEFWITLNPEYITGIDKLEKFHYIYVLYYMDQKNQNDEPGKIAQNLKELPAWAPEFEVGVFATRSPNHPNRIGLSVVQIKEIEGYDIVISGIDAYNNTPLLDIKPYIHSVDLKEDANDGWFEELANKNHSIAHMFDLSHDHEHDHNHHGHHINCEDN